MENSLHGGGGNMGEGLSCILKATEEIRKENFPVVLQKVFKSKEISKKI